MDDGAEIPDGDGHNRDGQKHPEREHRREFEHEINRQDHRGNGRRRVHDSRAENHADGVEIVRGARHEVAGPIADVEFGFEADEPGEHVVPQVVFNLARHSDQNPAGPKREESLHQHRRDQNQAVNPQRPPVQREVEGKEPLQ